MVADCYVNLVGGNACLAPRVTENLKSSMAAREPGPVRMLVYASSEIAQQRGVPRCLEGLCTPDCLTLPQGRLDELRRNVD